jgi:hypothetical protein
MQSVYVPFDDEEDQPLDKTVPPELCNYISQEQWDGFRISTEKLVRLLHREYMIWRVMGILLCCVGVAVTIVSSTSVGALLFLGVIALVVGIFVVSPLFYKMYYLSRLWTRMTAHCKASQDTTFQGIALQFKKDKGEISAADAGISETIRTTNYYIDVWVFRAIDP